MPFYLDWKFWLAVFSLTVSTVAIILSQLPPLRILLRRARLEIEVYSRMVLMHIVGSPSAQVHLIISNTGGKEIRIKRIKLHFQHDSQARFTLPAQGYLKAATDSDSVLLTSFRLEPHEEWGHIVNFFNLFSHKDEEEHRQLAANLRQNILEKRSLLEDEKNAPDVAADEEIVQPLINFFKNKFRWQHGEYELAVEVQAEPANTSVNKKYRITLFESDAKELEDWSLDYQYGYGISYAVRRRPVFAHLIESYSMAPFVNWRSLLPRAETKMRSEV